METEDILKALTTLEKGHFPRAALEAAIAQREAITPHLLRVLEETRQDELERMFAETDYMLPRYALYLLAQFRETRAYPLIVDIFAIPGEDVHDAFGDLVTEDLNRILASVSGGDVKGLHRLIEDPLVDEYVRAAAMEALVVLFVQDVLTREEVIAYFQYLFREGLEREYSFAWDALVSESKDLYSNSNPHPNPAAASSTPRVRRSNRSRRSVATILVPVAAARSINNAVARGHKPQYCHLLCLAA